MWWFARRSDVEALQQVVQQNHAELQQAIHDLTAAQTQTATPVKKKSWWERSKNQVIGSIACLVAISFLVAPILSWIYDKKSWSTGVMDFAVGVAGAIGIACIWWSYHNCGAARRDGDGKSPGSASSGTTNPTTTAHGSAGAHPATATTATATPTATPAAAPVP